MSKLIKLSIASIAMFALVGANSVYAQSVSAEAEFTTSLPGMSDVATVATGTVEVSSDNDDINATIDVTGGGVAEVTVGMGALTLTANTGSLDVNYMINDDMSAGLTHNDGALGSAIVVYFDMTMDTMEFGVEADLAAGSQSAYFEMAINDDMSFGLDYAPAIGVWFDGDFGAVGVYVGLDVDTTAIDFTLTAMDGDLEVETTGTFGVANIHYYGMDIGDEGTMTLGVNDLTGTITPYVTVEVNF